MGSNTRRTSTTTLGALEKLSEELDRLDTLEANVIRMRRGVPADADHPVGEPPDGSDPQTVKKLREIEKVILARARGEESKESSSSVKDKIVETMKKKS